MDKATSARRLIYKQSRVNVDESWAIGLNVKGLDVHAISVIAGDDPVRAAKLAKRIANDECSACGQCSG